MSFPILGLHHVTATVDDAQADLDFAVDALGRRLVKKTVNFDNRGVYPFYYGDERGTPGSPVDDVSQPVPTRPGGHQERRSGEGANWRFVMIRARRDLRTPTELVMFERWTDLLKR